MQETWESLGSNPGSGRSPGGGNGNPLQYSCLGNPMDRGTWQVQFMGPQRLQTWLSTHYCYYFISQKHHLPPIPWPLIQRCRSWEFLTRLLNVSSSHPASCISTLGHQSIFIHGQLREYWHCIGSPCYLKGGESWRPEGVHAVTQIWTADKMQKYRSYNTTDWTPTVLSKQTPAHLPHVGLLLGNILPLLSPPGSQELLCLDVIPSPPSAWPLESDHT